MSDNSWTNKLYFIVSSPRSGSSMLRNRLSDFEFVLALPGDMQLMRFYRTHRSLFHHNHGLFRIKFQEWYSGKQLRGVKDIHWHEFLSWKAEEIAEFLFQVFRLHALSLNRAITKETIFVEKSPDNANYVEFIRKHFAKSSIVHLYRDPRDVVASLNTKAWSGHNTYTNAKRWARENATLLTNAHCSICYEQLVNDPTGQLELLLSFMHYPNLDEISVNRAKDIEKNSKALSETGRAIHSENTAKYLRTLSAIDRDIEMVEAVCFKVMRTLGYEPRGTHYDFSYYRKKLFLASEYYINQSLAMVRFWPS